MTTTIRSNGSKWGGQAPDPIEALEARLRTNTLDPRFEAYGNFVYKPTRGVDVWHLFGNFYDVSAVFNVDTDDPVLVRRLRRLIRRNQATAAYRAASEETT